MAQERMIPCRELIDLFLDGKSVDQSIEVLKQKFHSEGDELEIPSALRTLRLFKLKFLTKFKQCNRKQFVFLKKCSKWINSNINFKLASNQPSRLVGRPKKSFRDSSKKTKLRKINNIRQSIPPNELTLAAVTSQRAAGNRDLAWVIEHLSNHPEKATSVRRLLECGDSEANPSSLSIVDALTFLCQNDLTKLQYQSIRMMSLERGANIYPTYNELREGKSMCYPKGITTRSYTAEVSLQLLLDHTIQRLFVSQEDKILPYLEQSGKFTVIFKWGCDGSSNHSKYKMPFAEEVDGEQQTFNDSHIFLICLVPLRISFRADNSDVDQIVWNNDLPSSINLCRPVKMVFQKENAVLTRKEVDNINQQIANLSPTIFEFHNRQITVQSKLCLTMIDGKVLNDLTNTNSQACHLCGASGRSLSNPSSIPITDEPADFEIMPILHAYIRSMEFLLNIAYRIPLQKWRINKGNEVLKERQQTIRGNFKLIGLRISEPLPSGGNSNDGNTARRFFGNPSETAEITGLDVEIIQRFSNILRALSSKMAINVAAYQDYAEQTRLRLTLLYSFYPLSPSVHRMLVHGASIIKHCVLPIGMMTEEVQERGNKSIRYFREHHSRKCDRQANIEDVYKRLMLTSDPVISLNIKNSKTVSDEFPDEIRNLLLF